MRLLKRASLCVPLVALGAVLIGLPTIAFGRDDGQNFRTTLIGLNEVPSINTEGTAHLKLKLNADSMDFTLTYANLSGPPAAAQQSSTPRCGWWSRPPPSREKDRWFSI